MQIWLNITCRHRQFPPKKLQGHVVHTSGRDHCKSTEMRVVTNPNPQAHLSGTLQRRSKAAPSRRPAFICIYTVGETLPVHAAPLSWRYMRCLRLLRGDLTKHRASAIATSANAGLCGNRSPDYWRFQRFPNNLDGMIHSAAGPELLDVCFQCSHACA